MKKINITILSISIFVFAIYFAFIFILPRFINPNKYTPQISSAIMEKTGMKVKLNEVKISTDWDLSIGTKIHKMDLYDLDGEKFAQINDLKLNLSLLPLIFNNLKVSKIEAEKVIVNADIKKMALIKEKFNKNTKKSSIKLNLNIPDIIIKKYRLSVLNNSQNYTLKGENLKIYDFIPNKKLKISTNGNLILNGRKQITYNIKLNTHLLSAKNDTNDDWLKVLQEIYNYNLNSEVNVDLKITQKNSQNDYQGKIDIKKITFNLGGKTFPNSNLLLNLKGNKVYIDSTLYTDINSKSQISGIFKNSKDRFIDLHVQSKNVNLANAIPLIDTIMKTIRMKKFDEISASGILDADFNIKSDFKKVKSDGFLKIKNAEMKHKKYNVALKSINADIDFSQDSINITKASAFLNTQPIQISGNIDKNAKANIFINAEKLPLKGALLTLGQTKVLKENDILAGILDIKITLKGRLDKAKPQIKLIVKSPVLKNKSSKIKFKASKILVESTQKEDFKAQIYDTKLFNESNLNISTPKLILNSDGKNIDILNSYLYINGIKTNLCGRISNIKNPQFQNVSISLPNAISMPIQGYTDSSIIAKGIVNINGNINKPDVRGSLDISYLRIPTLQLNAKNISISIDKIISFNCPQLIIAGSQAALKGTLNPDFSQGIVVNFLDFQSTNLDLNRVLPALKNIPQNSNSSLTVLTGKNTINYFKVANITATNITSGICIKNGVLHLNELFSDAYGGKVAGKISYDFKQKRTHLNLQGRELSANPALLGLTGRNDEIYGKLDFDTDISISGYTKRELLNSLNGSTNFIISNGKMGVLGKFEHLLYAQNILSNNVFKASLNVIAKAVTVKNTGVYKYMKGRITFANGWANIVQLKTSGPSMSLYITGRCYLPDNIGNLTILGRISDDVVKILGPIGEFSMDKIVSYIPRMGEVTSFFVGQFTTNPNYENTALIPDLTPKTQFATKEFKVIIDGELQKQNAVKSFKWISNPKVEQYQFNKPNVDNKKESTLPDFVNNLPDLKQ